MTDVAVENRPVVVLTLKLALTAGERQVTPPRELATGIPEGEAARDELSERLDLAARRAYASEDVSVQAVRFSDVGPGHVTVTLDVVTQSGDAMPAEQFAGGLTGLTDHARGPLEVYLRGVTGESDLDVDIAESGVEQREPDPPPATAPVTLTRGQQRLARWITGVGFILVILFVVVLLLVTR